ncbi:MAG: DNA-binding domain-containing protein [gamma proteobacterium symbiont of Bathyaustriella thionipta]|nr:DNA-binding domain-containing protein [gamma proteobacterium symbiont of Bathyaustriella thionipta]MCU7950365.1 DNA-binding domain-containing protein [gamma proteobacterium symbiont of Bathyaustriella thionipta]MCU7951861.1 DNA-binding domain-containing protein [gamma proteobacterium symbiont of Bathyaustriella thionipta]MCU7956111.1 DNA-binding domain-containing protein [gamma proteobacterium symbiont of Bathyaustriella thionipta]MCU7966470.1 DNA-binding domain-containing protein [gamma pro
MNEAHHKLGDLQQQMLSWLQLANPQIKQSVTGTAKVPVQTRLDIYANAYKFRLIEALEDTFPALHTLLGDDDFFQLGVDYLNEKPSQHFSLRYFGHQMSSFLAFSEGYKEQTILAEMAQFEWLLREAFDAANKPHLNLESLQTIAPEQWLELKFDFHPTVNRINLCFNVPQLWQAIDNDEPPIEMLENDYPIGWCIWRKDLRTLYRSMDVDEAWALDAMLCGNDFSYICQGICEWIDEQYAPARVAGFIQNWVNEGLINKIQIKPVLT